MEKIKVWTRQDKRVLEVLKTEGTYRCKSNYIDEKMENFSDYYKKLYQWYSHKAKEIVPKPDASIEYPVWVSIDEDLQLQHTEGTVILVMEVPAEQVLITDMEKWGYVVNFFYLPYDHEDADAHDKELKRFGIGDEASLIMGDKGNFYPLLKRKIEQSWNRLFEPYKISDYRQGTLWEIKSEWIVEIIGEG